MIHPKENESDAARAALLTLDCPIKPLANLIKSEVDAVLSNNSRFKEYVEAALTSVTISEASPEGIQTIQEQIVFAAVAALRIQKANPFQGTAFESREPPESAERRMLHQPLWKHPGLSEFALRARLYYISTMQWVFRQRLSSPLQSEIASVLIAPDSPDPRRQESREYVSNTPREVHNRYCKRVEVTDSGVWFPIDNISNCCRIPPRDESHFSTLYDDLSPLRIENGRVFVPQQVFQIKLSEYSWHAWAKLVNIAYNSLTNQDIERLVDATPSITSHILQPFRGNKQVYFPFYGVENTTNPKREWNQKVNANSTSKPLQIEDKRLLTIVDCFRANSGLRFNEPTPVERLYAQLRRFFPSPQRPGNDISSKETLLDALENASSSAITLTINPESGTLCSFSKPKFTPIYPNRSLKKDHPWNYYLLLRSQQSLNEPARVQRQRDYSNVSSTIDPRLPVQDRYSRSTLYEESVDYTQQIAVTTPHTLSSIQAVVPAVDPESFSALTRDDLIFVSRVGMAMERLLSDYSLTTSMRPLRLRKDGSKLEIDEQKLIECDWLEKHPEGRAVLYTVPARRRKQLQIPNLSHDGFGEKTSREKSLHRRGIDRVAASLAAKSDVTRVVRYCDLWRLQSTRCEPALQTNDLLSTRIDVIGFNAGEPQYAAEVETAANTRTKSEACVDKLSALSETLETSLVVPNPNHMWTIMRRLDTPEYFDFEAFPASSPDHYSPSTWVTKLENEGVLGEFFDELCTYRSLDSPTIDLQTDTRQRKIVGFPDPVE